MRSFFEHLHPPLVRRRTLDPLATLGLGIACLTCLAVLVITGLCLFAYYVPAREEAYERILHIATALPYGHLVRDLHRVSANALLILGLLHLARVFLTGCYKGRWVNWSFGLVLLLLVLVANYTGYLLPWDQTSFWALKVGSQLLAYVPWVGPLLQRLLVGGGDIGPDSLPRAFALHAGVVPAGLALFTCLHLWRIRKDGGLATPEPEGPKLPASPWLYRLEAAGALLTLSVLLAAALSIHAPIAERADALHPPNPAKAPWYFVGIQEMVSHSAFAGGLVVPALIAMFLILAPGLDRSPSKGGRWFSRDRRWWNLAFAAILASQLAFIAVGQWFRAENWKLHVPWTNQSEERP